MKTTPFAALRFCFIAACAFSLAGGLKAAPVSLKFRAMTVDLPLPSGAFYFQAVGVNKPLEAPKLGLSRNTYAQYVGDSTMHLYVPQKTDDGKTISIDVGSVTFPPGSTVYMVILAVGADGKIIGSAVSDSPADFPANHTRFINAAGIPVAVCCDTPPEQKKIIAPTQTLILPNGTDRQGEIRGFVQKKGQWLESYNTAVMAAPTMRRTALIVLKNADQIAANPLLLPKIVILCFTESPVPTDAAAKKPGGAGTRAAPKTGGGQKTMSGGEG